MTTDASTDPRGDRTGSDIPAEQAAVPRGPSGFLLWKSGLPLWRSGLSLTLVGVAGVLLTHWMVFSWLPDLPGRGMVQRIFYVHAPVAWITQLAFAVTALASVAYLWRRDERADAVALAAAEGGLFFGVALLVVGPLWARIAWGTWWTWEPRLTLTLLLWFIFLGYLLVRNASQNPEKGKRFAAVVAIVGALDIPLIHMSVRWFRSLHPDPAVTPGPVADPAASTTLGVSMTAYTLVFLGLFVLRYGVEVAERSREVEGRPGGSGGSTGARGGST